MSRIQPEGLLPCPHCGSANVIVLEQLPQKYRWVKQGGQRRIDTTLQTMVAKCQHCGASTSGTSTRASGIAHQLAVDAWNARVEESGAAADRPAVRIDEGGHGHKID